MTRWLFNLATALSLLLCVATLALWVRSYFVSDSLHYRTKRVTTTRDVEHTGPSVGMTRGQVFVGHSMTITNSSYNVQLPEPLDGGLRLGRQPATKRPENWGWAGFHRETINTNISVLTARGTAYYVPMWFLILLTVPIPAFRLRSLLKRRRLMRKGQCLICGYDLRATPERCPECGSLPDASRNIIPVDSRRD